MLKRQTFLESRLVELAIRHGIDVSGVNCDESVLARNAPDVEVQALAELIRRLRRRLNDELMGMTARPVPAGTFDISMKAALHARSLNEFLRTLIGAAELMYSPPDLRCTIEVERGEVAITFENAFHPEDDLFFVFGFMVTHRGMCWLVDEQICLLRVELRGQPAEHLDDLRHIFQCECRLGQRRNALVFSAHYLDAAINRSLPELNEYLDRRPLDVLYIPGKDRSLTHQVLNRLRQALEDRQSLPDARQLCEALQLHAHGLSRQLAREGRTLQGLKDQVRHEVAVRALTQTTTSVEQIALRLGYAEPNSFCRAFKRWTGAPPQAFRALTSSTRPAPSPAPDRAKVLQN